MSTIALCIPAYNAAWCLPRLLESANNQQIKFNEILVYNDCSTDATEEVALKYGAKVVNGVKNMGCSFGKNKLAEISNSEWLHFHDADDELLLNFTSTVLKWTEREKPLDILLLNFKYEDFDTKEVLGYANFDRESLLKDQTKFVLTHKLVNFALIKKSSFLKIGGFNTDPKVLYNEDRAFYSRAVVSNLVFDYEHFITCINYRYNESMSASNQLKCAYAHFNVSIYLSEKLGNNYYKEISDNFFENAKFSASFQEWKLTRANIAYGLKLNNAPPSFEGKLFKIFFKVNAFFAYWLREKVIRIFKPNLRNENFY